MTAHVCGAFTGPKLTACCCCCGLPTYDILETMTAGPRAGEAGRVGLMLESGTQVEILLSDGSLCHFDMCVECATHLGPGDLAALWTTHVARINALCRIAGRRENQRRAIVRAAARLWPVGVTRWRRQDRELVGVVPDGLVVDRRRPQAAAPSSPSLDDAPASLAPGRDMPSAEGVASSPPAADSWVILRRRQTERLE